MRLQPVPAQLVVVVERVAAHGAHELLAAGVRGAVAAQARRVPEALAAELAHVRVDAAVAVLVPLQRLRRAERLAAEDALEVRTTQRRRQRRR